MIQIFKNEQFGEIRTSEFNGEPVFCLSDVCKSLDISNVSDCKSRLRAKGVVITDTLTSGGIQSMTYVDESNLYKCVFQSRKPDAEKFQDWVCEDVLPSIRKNGAYMTDETIEKALTSPDFLIQLATKLKEEQSKNRILECANKDNLKVIEQQKPKALFADAVATSNRSCLIAELSKILQQNGVNIGQNRLFQWMRDHHYLGSKGEYYNQPTQKGMELELFEIKKTTITKPDGTVLVTTTTKVSGKGQIYFVNKFLS